MSTTTDAYQLLRMGRQKPATFGRVVFGSNYERWQKVLMSAVNQHSRVSLITANGVGKTFTLADLAVWFTLCYPPAVVVTTAGSWTQVRRQLWKEIRRTYHNLPPSLQWGKMNSTDWQISEDWFALGLSTNHEHLFEGFHERNILVIVDEAKSVQAGIFDAINRIFAGNSRIVKVVQASSPGLCRGVHYDSFNSAADRWVTMKVCPFEGQSYLQGRSGKRVIIPSSTHLTAEYIQEMKDEYGERSPLYRSMVCAEHSEDALGKFFPQSVLQDMRIRLVPGEKDKLGDIWLGCDVARSNAGDESVITVVQDILTPLGLEHDILAIIHFHTRDEAIYADKVQAIAGEYGAEANHINVESDGVGGGVIDILHRRGFYVNECIAGGGKDPDYPVNVKNLKAQAWLTASKKAANPKGCLIHGIEDSRTIAQLNDPMLQYTDMGEIKVESKEQMSKRIKKEDPRRSWCSPDRADSVIWAVHRPLSGDITYITDYTTGEERGNPADSDSAKQLWGGNFDPTNY